MSSLRAIPTMLRIGLAEAVAYRAEIIVWMLTMTMPLVSLALWSAVADEAPVGRFASRDFTAYFLATLVVRQLTGSWVVWELNQDIKTGTLTRRLLKPIHPVLAYGADNLAAIPLRAAFAAPFALILLIATRPERIATDPARIAIFVVSLFGAWLITFFTMVFIGALSFFMESSTSMFDVWLVGFMLLSGYLMPLELFPGWVRTLATALPFRYTLAFPVETVIGLLDEARALRELGIQWLYVAGTAAAALWIFRLGVRRYGAYGG